MSTEHNPYLKFPPARGLDLSCLESAGDPRTTTLRDVVGDDGTSLDDLAEASACFRASDGNVVLCKATAASKVQRALLDRAPDPRADAWARLLIENPDADWFDFAALEPVRTKGELAAALFTDAELDSTLAELGKPSLESGDGWYRAEATYRRVTEVSVLVRAWSEEDASLKLEALWGDDWRFVDAVMDAQEDMEESGFFVEEVREAEPDANDRAGIVDDIWTWAIV